MGIEYKVVWSQPEHYDPRAVLHRLPSPISESHDEIYNYSVETYGFYFVDHLVDKHVASVAFRIFIDEALAHARSVEVLEV